MTWRVRLVSGGFRAVELLSASWKTTSWSPDADALIDAALEGAGRPHVALDDIVEPLGRFLRAVEDEAQLSALGRYATRWDVHRLLSNLLRLRVEEQAAPEILDEPVAAPLFITGIPRSGTTFLHRLMAEDPATQAPLCWQTIYPYPDAGSCPDGRDARPRRVATQLRGFSALMPEIRSVHPMYSQSPQECTELTAHVFQSLRFDITYDIPSYRRWLGAIGHTQAYRFHRTFLQHLQRQGGRRRWILKCPDHVFALDALRLVYPDAKVVFVHRDPLKVMASVARLTELLRIPFARRVDRRNVGRQVLDDWVRGCAIMVDADRHQLFAPSNVLHVHYAEIAARPLDVVTRIYRHFGLPLTPEAVDGVRRLVERKPRGGYGRNTYSLEPYGIGAGEIRDRFQDYMRHFDISAEGGPSA